MWSLAKGGSYKKYTLTYLITNVAAKVHVILRGYALLT